MQILHPFSGSVQQYLEQLSDPDQHRPACCPQCQANDPLTAHGFYSRTIIDAAFDELMAGLKLHEATLGPEMVR